MPCEVLLGAIAVQFIDRFDFFVDMFDIFGSFVIGDFYVDVSIGYKFAQTIKLIKFVVYAVEETIYDTNAENWGKDNKGNDGY